jgi:ABC-type dipeptide/oligopeptide/nickel transport system permease subunit
MATGELLRAEPVVRPVRWRLAALRRAPVVPLGIIIILVLTALLANILTPYSPVNISLPDRLRPPFWEQGGSLAHPLGTDPMGRDLLTRLIYGARISLLVGFLGLLVGGGVGAALGLIAGYARGRLDAFLMRVTDTTLSFPIILFAILLVVILGASLLTVVFAVALVLWARFPASSGGKS